MEVGAARRGEVTEAQLREAQRGFTRLLFSKRFPRDWIEENSADLLAQAHAEFAERLAKGREDATVGLLILIAYRRAQALLTAQRRKPPTASIETVTELADEGAPTPEEETIEHDRRERIVRAMSRLPERERKLLTLVYFDGMSIREAGRRLGWQKSAADRHHQAAIGRLRPLLGDREHLADVGIPAFAATFGADRGWLGATGHLLRGGVQIAAQRLTEVWRRLSPLAEPGNAATAGGAGRAAVGVCGATAAVLCGLAATGVVGPGVAGIAPHASKPKRATAPAAHEVSARSLLPSKPHASAKQSAVVAHEPRPKAKLGQGGEAAKADPTAERRQGRQSVGSVSAPMATVKQTVGEFGVEGGSGSAVQSSPEASSAPSNLPSSSTTVRAAPSSPSSGSAPPAKQSAASSSSEFGM